MNDNKSSDDQRLPGIAHRIIHMVIKASGYRNRYIGGFFNVCMALFLKRSIVIMELKLQKICCLILQE